MARKRLITAAELKKLQQSQVLGIESAFPDPNRTTKQILLDIEAKLEMLMMLDFKYGPEDFADRQRKRRKKRKLAR